MNRYLSFPHFSIPRPLANPLPLARSRNLLLNGLAVVGLVLAGPGLSSAANANDENRLRPSPQLDDFSAAVQQIESDLGAWGQGLDEQLQGLAKTYQLRGQHLEAIEIYERAIHVNRINQGLYNLSQVPLVKGLVESLIARGQWDAVHDRQQYLYWVHQRNFGQNDPRLLPVIDDLGRWYINDYAMNGAQRSADQLISAHTMFTNATQIISSQYGANDLRMAQPLRGIALSNYFFATYSAGTTSQLDRAEQTNKIGPELSRSQYDNALAGGPIGNGIYYPESDLAPQLLRHIRTSYPDGKAALSRLVEIYNTNPDAPLGAAATAKIELGDWQMLFSKTRSATDYYSEAYSELAKNEATKPQIAKLFGYPVALPDMDLLEADTEQSVAAEAVAAQLPDGESVPATPDFVLVRFDVDRFGAARNIDILESFPENHVGNRLRVKRSLENMKFRPRFENGAPVTTAGLVHKYVFAANR